MTEIAICDHHKEADDIDNFLSDEGFVKLSKFMREYGKPSPVQRHTSLAWKEIPEESLASLTPITIPDRNRDDELAF